MDTHGNDRTLDQGTAYHRPPSHHLAELTEVSRGTPMGELLRRYWHPIGLIRDAGPKPLRVRALGEDLVLFRDGDGRASLVWARCCHRGTTLYYGKVEERGIRCCYHGWLFDVEGRCLEQPCEPELGRQRHKLRQPWYPVEVTERGVKSLQIRRLADGRLMHRITEVALPTLRVVPNPYLGSMGRVESIGWTLPIDDTHYRIYVAGRVMEGGTILPRVPDGPKRKPWREMTEGERRDFPGDWEAQVGQGAITFHSEEHLATSDKGVAMLRRLLKRQVDAVAQGKDPIGVNLDSAAPIVRFEAGNWVASGQRGVGIQKT
jgi:nitrite reductase/ring-hydroxylating ferredoxin subunit